MSSHLPSPLLAALFIIRLSSDQDESVCIPREAQIGWVWGVRDSGQSPVFSRSLLLKHLHPQASQEISEDPRKDTE